MEQFAIKCKNANIPIRVAGGGESSGGRGDLAAAGRVLDRIEGAEPDATGVVAGNPVRHTHGVPLGKKGIYLESSIALCLVVIPHDG